MPKYRQNCKRLPKKVRDYLDNGVTVHRNNTVHWAAQQFKDCGLSLEYAINTIWPRAEKDGLSQPETEKAIRSAYNQRQRPPPFGFHRGGGAAPAQAAAPIAGQTAPPSLSMPGPIADGFAQFLSAVFKADEYVAISEAIPDNSAGFAPGPGQTLKREKWLEFSRDGRLAKMFPDQTGVYIRINPMKPGGKTDADVTAFRHVLVEFDLDENGNRIPLETQYQAFFDSKLPISTVAFSGDKSLHALVCVNAATRAEYDERREMIWKVFEPYWIDEQNKNPSRYSRAPGFFRTLVDTNGALTRQSEQQLLALGLGTADWQEWESARTVWPYESLVDLAEAQIDHSQTLFGDRWLEREQTLFVVGPSGVGKSVFVTQFCFLAAVGRDAFDIRTCQDLGDPGEDGATFLIRPVWRTSED